jgi:hypothetical protein
MCVEVEFYFFHVGGHCELTSMMVKSLRLTNPKSRIVQLTDRSTKSVDEVDEVIRYKIDPTPIMFARSLAYAAAPVSGRMRLFIDTDMLVVREILSSDFELGADLVVCRRAFNGNMFVNTSFQGMNMREFEGLTLDEAWPFLGCFVGAVNREPLEMLCSAISQLPEKYRRWYGDQIALKRLAANSAIKLCEVSEAKFGYLPCDNTDVSWDRIKQQDLKILHFKGRRKIMMKQAFDMIFNAN